MRKKIAIVHGPLGMRSWRANIIGKMNFNLKFIGLYTNVKVSDICYDNNMENVELIKLPIKSIFFDPISIMKKGKPSILSWVFFEKLENYLEDVDIIWTSETYTFISRQCALIAQKLSKPLLVYVWETIPNYILNKVPPYSKNSKFVIKNTDIFIATTKCAKRYLKSLGIDEERIKVVYPGIDMTRFYPIPKKTTDNVKILYVGALERYKGVYTLLKAFAKLNREFKDIELWICGTGSLSSLVIDYSKKLPIRYLGFIDHNLLPKIYNNCDIFCLPSQDKRLFNLIKIWEEQYGQVLVEAMATGLPIVATNCGAIPEVIGTKNFIVRQGNAIELFNSLRVLIEDGNLRNKIGRYNIYRAKKIFNSDREIYNLEKIISNIVT